MRVIPGNLDYDFNDGYVSYELGIYLKSGILNECMDNCIVEELEESIK